MIPRVNEGTSFEVETTFYGPDGSVVSPSSVDYRIDCVTTGGPIRDWTAISPGGTVTIPIEKDENAILDSSNQVEEKLLTIRAAYGAGKQITQDFRWYTKNLMKI